MKSLFIALAALALTAPVAHLPAAAQFAAMPEADGDSAPQVIDATDPELIARILRSEGFKAELKTLASGAVEIESEYDGASFWLYFQACTVDFTGCEVISFSSGFDFETAQLPDIIGDWNHERYSKAYLDEDGDPFVEFSVNMKGGVTRQNFVDTLHWFTTEMSAFIEQIGWNRDLSGQAQPI